ncbi:MAG: hypothetical protein HY815_21120, partial [Candidatus Riflebacteria bacterium]|nr:hypothetical protein [Candidatus Riflebacteria bacterium]
RTGSPPWGLVAALLSRELAGPGGVSPTALAVRLLTRLGEPDAEVRLTGSGVPVKGAVISAATDPDLSAQMASVREAIGDAREIERSTEGGSASIAIKKGVDRFRDILYGGRRRNGSLEWGTWDDNGPAGLVREMTSVVPFAEGLMSDSPFKRVFGTFASHLASQEASESRDSGYWEARALVHRFAGDPDSEERALARALVGWYRRVSGSRFEPSRRGVLLERLAELAAERAREGKAAIEPLPGAWPQPGPAELFARRSVMAAAWALRELATQTTDPAGTSVRTVKVSSRLKQVLSTLQEDDAWPGLARWGESRR